MVKIAELKVDQLRFLVRERNLAVSGSRAELVQRLIDCEKSEDVEMPQAAGISSPYEEETLTSQAATISQMQNEMTELKNMMVQLVIMQRKNAEATALGATTKQQQQIREENIEGVSHDINPGRQATNNVRQASVKEIANTLPDYDPSDDNAISVDQFIDRVNKVVDAYQWDEKFLLLAIYTRLKGPAKMWLDSSPVLHTTWSNFATAILEEFGSNPDEAEVHFNMANATRRAKETVKEYCFRMSALGVRYKLSEAAVIRYVRSGLQHRELQNSIAAIQFSSMKQFRDAAESYFVNRGRPVINKKEFLPKGSNLEPKQDYDVKTTKPKEAQKCYNCGELGHFANSCPQEKKKSRCAKCNKFHVNNEKCQPANMMRLGASNQDKLFTRKIYIQSCSYSAFIDTGSQASIIRQSVAKQINAERKKCSMKIRGICGGSCILTEAIIVDMDIDGKIITAKVYIADDELLQEDFLLGQDVIISAHLSLKFEPGETNNDQERSQMRGLLEKFTHVFSTGLQGIGKTNIVQANISVESGQVVSQAPYRVAEPKKEVVSRMVDELLQQDIIIPSTSEYASPVVLIKKPNGSDRLCVDYRRLNKLIKKENFPVPNIEERLQEAKRFKYFSSLDLNSGYYQIEVAPESRKYTAFITTDGLYEFKRLPFGLKTAPAVFNRLMAELQKRVQKGDMIHYMDDILIGSQTFDEMYEKLQRILQVLQECGLTLNLDKCELYKQSITFLGHKIHADGISPGEVKTNAIALFSPPSNVTEVRQFLGLSGYFRKFVAGYAIISDPLRALLRKDQTFKWEQPQQDAFEELKRRLISKPVVTSYRIDAEHELHTDASAVGLAGVLLQKDEDQMKPIAYYSRATSKPEKNYHSYELEALAVVESLERFKYYIYGKRIKVITDCNALKTSMEKRELIPRIARWWLRIQEFDIDIVHRAGTQMNHVDALSRAPFEDAHEMDTASLKISKTIIDEADWLFAIQLQDEKIQKIVAEMNLDTKSENDEYVIEQDRLFRKYDNKLLWLLYGYEPRDILKNTLTSAIQGPDQKMMTEDELEKLRADAATTVNDHRAAAKKRYDARHSKPTVYTLGDLVLVENEPFSTGTSRKLEPRYKGPFIVNKVLPNDRYLVEDIPYAQRKQRHYKSVYSSDRMKRWCELPPDEPDEDDDKEGESREDAVIFQERPTVKSC
ncbi:uncharacterized protein DMAD_09873 [Drosophila madeirensis]|uniref:RNA-directed DNA polymerase n=1 Tax=Drosophila madeirensis TaxID=30013 RepID=A0AAU9F3L5_DROMD